VLALAAVVCAAGALTLWAAPHEVARAQAPLVAQGAALFRAGCAYCHGDDGRGYPGRGPSLRGVGAAAADFYLSTGRMPLSQPDDPPVRNEPAYDAQERRALVAFVASFGGPPVPAVDPRAGSLREGMQAFADRCAGCHAMTGRGGVVPGAVAPALQQASPAQIAEAIRVGPYLMPEFPPRQVDQAELDSITRYVLSLRDPPDRGGWGLGDIGPIPEGMVAWLLAGTALLIVLRLMGERIE
jgi:ubiquinol-cytochrome c reductase cytochrome c subunit